MEIRLNKFIAQAGVASRRKADELIKAGEIKVNGKLVKVLGHKLSHKDQVVYKGKTLKPEKKYYLLLNKPKDFICSNKDEKGRKVVMDLMRTALLHKGINPATIFPVGRLDRNTTGLLILTNDGDLAQKLTHPSYNIRKVYFAALDKPLKTDHLEKIREGIKLEDGPVKVYDIQLPYAQHPNEVGIEIHSGRNRIVRRIFEHFKYDVKRLDRAMVGPLMKKDLPRGKWRFLTDKEVILLKHYKN